MDPILYNMLQDAQTGILPAPFLVAAWLCQAVPQGLWEGRSRARKGRRNLVLPVCFLFPWGSLLCPKGRHSSFLEQKLNAFSSFFKYLQDQLHCPSKALAPPGSLLRGPGPLLSLFPLFPVLGLLPPLLPLTVLSLSLTFPWLVNNFIPS